MTDRKKKLRPRKRSVQIGGTSQSAFAGYAPNVTPPKPKSDQRKDRAETQKDEGDQ